MTPLRSRLAKTPETHPEAAYWEALLADEGLAPYPDQVEYVQGFSIVKPRLWDTVSENFPYPPAPDYHRLQKAWDMVRYLPVQDQFILWNYLQRMRSQESIANELGVKQPSVHYRIAQAYMRLNLVATLGLPPYRDTVRLLLYENPPIFADQPVGHHILTYGHYWAISIAGKACGVPNSTMQHRIRSYVQLLTGPHREWLQTMIESPLARIKNHPNPIPEREWHEVGVSLYDPTTDTQDIPPEHLFHPAQTQPQTLETT